MALYADSLDHPYMVEAMGSWELAVKFFHRPHCCPVNLLLVNKLILRTAFLYLYLCT